jgi:hypothetical protein
MRDPLLQLTLALPLALLFLHGAWHKYRDIAGFRAQLAAYRMLPVALLPAVATGLPVAEASTALMLLLPATRAAAAALGLSLFLLYALAMLVNLRRGRSWIDCGCGGAAQPLSYGLVLRNLILAAGAALLLLPAHVRTLGVADLLLLCALSALLALAYLAANQLQYNASKFSGGAADEY